MGFNNVKQPSLSFFCYSLFCPNCVLWLWLNFVQLTAFMLLPLDGGKHGWFQSSISLVSPCLFCLLRWFSLSCFSLVNIFLPQGGWLPWGASWRNNTDRYVLLSQLLGSHPRYCCGRMGSHNAPGSLSRGVKWLQFGTNIHSWVLSGSFEVLILFSPET